jgi:hypothetical protein
MTAKTTAMLAPIILIILLFGLAPRQKITTTILIAAPPARVWAVLADLNAYPAWNPEMTLKGNLVPGATIENIESPGSDQEVFFPTLLAVKPNQELRWLGHLPLAGRFWLPRVLDAEHYFLLRPTSDGGTSFTQAERFRGVVLWVFDAKRLVPQFNAMNAALKARAEAKP